MEVGSSSNLAAFSKILVPHDGSNSADRALDYAVKIASEGEPGQVVVMHVIPSFPELGQNKMTKNSQNYLNDVYDELQTDADKSLEKLKVKYASYDSVSITTHVIIGGRVADRIIDYANDHDVDLIVINSRNTLGQGKSRLKFWVPLGSVSRAVSEMASCPVMLVRPA